MRGGEHTAHGGGDEDVGEQRASDAADDIGYGAEDGHAGGYSEERAAKEAHGLPVRS